LVEGVLWRGVLAMGNCCSNATYLKEGERPAGDPGEKPTAIIVWSAKGLRKGDIAGNDPYCVVRVGKPKEPWSEKMRSAGRRSQTASGVNPAWNFGFAINTAHISQPEVHIRVFDQDFLDSDDFLGDAVVSLQTLLSSGGAPMDLALGGDHDAKGTVQVSAGPLELLQDNKLSKWVGFETIGPIGKPKPWDVTDSASPIPVLVGGSSLPKNLRGIFWLTEQGSSSALASFGGPNHDGGGCSLGHITGNRCTVRVCGDRVWTFAETSMGEALESIDLVYHFTFDRASDPKKCQIYPEARNWGLVLKQEWLLDFEMVLKEEPDAEYPGSVVWSRQSFSLGQKVNEYALVQVVDETGKRIQPAWDKFVAYQKSTATGDSPGVIWYREAPEKGK